MNDLSADPHRPSRDLKAAIRMARAEDAERSEVIADLRTAAVARLGLLRDALEPVLAQIPDDIDLFDVGLMPGHPPRLFIDMVAFVETGRERHSYRFIQERRYGRVVLAETSTLDATVEAVMAYIARRIVEREKALATDAAHELWRGATAAPVSAGSSPDGDRSGTGRWRRRMSHAFWFVIEVLGLLAFFGLVLWAGRSLYLTRDALLAWLRL